MTFNSECDILYVAKPVFRRGIN